MKLYKKMICFVMLISVVIAFSACTKQKESQQIENLEENKNIEESLLSQEVIQTALQKLEEANSYEFDLIQEMSITIGSQSNTKKTTVHMASFKEPLKYKMDMTVDIDGDTETTQYYFDKIEDNITMYANIMGNWYKQAITQKELSQYYGDNSMNIYLNAATGLKKSDTTEGVTRYDGFIVKENMQQITEALGSAENLLSNTNLAIEEVYEDVKDIPLSVWIDEQGYAIKLELDIKDMMVSVMKKLADAGRSELDLKGVSFDSMKTIVTYQNFNNVEAFEIPEQAKNGIEV